MLTILSSWEFLIYFFFSSTTYHKATRHLCTLIILDFYLSAFIISTTSNTRHLCKFMCVNFTRGFEFSAFLTSITSCIGTWDLYKSAHLNFDFTGDSSIFMFAHGFRFKWCFRGEVQLFHVLHHLILDSSVFSLLL